MTSVDYKIRWNDIENYYEVHDLKAKKEMPTIPIPIAGKISEVAVSLLLQKLILHANQSNQTLSDSCTQLAQEIAYLYSDEMAMLKATRESDLEKLTAEGVNELLVGTAEQIRNVMLPVVEKIETMKDDLEELSVRLPKAVAKSPSQEQIEN